MSEQKPIGQGAEMPATPPRRLYPLANDAEGNPIRMPREAVAWRVKQLARRAGRPKLIFDHDTGRALEVALTATSQDLADQVGVSGRYRLEAIDTHGSVIPGCVAITELWFEDQEDEEQPAAPAVAAPPVVNSEAMAQLLSLIGTLVQTNSEVMQTMASAFQKIDPNTPPPEQPQAAAAAGLPPQLAQLAAMGGPMGMLDMFFNHIKPPGAPGTGGAPSPIPGMPFAAGVPSPVPGGVPFAGAPFVMPGVVVQPQQTPIGPVGPLVPIGPQGQKG